MFARLSSPSALTIFCRCFSLRTSTITKPSLTRPRPTSSLVSPNCSVTCGQATPEYSTFSRHWVFWTSFTMQSTTSARASSWMGDRGREQNQPLVNQLHRKVFNRCHATARRRHNCPSVTTTIDSCLYPPLPVILFTFISDSPPFTHSNCCLSLLTVTCSPKRQ